MFLPEAIAQYHDVGAPGLLFLRQERAAEHWLNRQGLEESRRNRARIYLLSLAGTGEGKASVGVDRHLLEDMILVLPVEIIRRRNREPGHARKTLRGRYVPDADELSGIMEWKRTEQYTVHHAEDCRVGANAQSQSG